MEPTCRGGAEKAAVVEMELEGHASHRECLGRRREAEDRRREVTEDPAGASSRDPRATPAEFVSQLGSGDDAVLVGDHLEQCSVEHTPSVGSGHRRTGKLTTNSEPGSRPAQRWLRIFDWRVNPPEIRSRDCVQRNVGSEFSIGEWPGGSGGEAEGGCGAGGLGAGGLGKVGATAGVEDRPRGVDDQAATVRPRAMLDHRRRVAALRSDPWDEDRHVGRDRSDVGQFGWIGGADDEPAVATFRPVVGDQAGDVGVDRRPVGDERLDVVATRVARAAQRDDPAAVLSTARSSRCQGTGSP